MQPWIDKASSSSGGGASTLHYDKTLSHIHHHHPSQQQGSSASGFRTARDVNASSSQQYHFTEKPSPFKPTFDFAPIQHTQEMLSFTDGGDVLNFLNSTDYSDHVHGDDLRPDSMSYISHRHQLDTQHALSEKEKLKYQWTTELLAAEDIVEYLMNNTNYTEDIYGIPMIGQFIKEAEKEIAEDSTSENSKKAIARLSMIRHHLLSQASGNRELAAQNALRMNESDWSQAFFDSSR